MSNDNIPTFEKLPRATRFKKSILFVAVIVLMIIAFIILSSISSSKPKNNTEDILENETANVQWLNAGTSINKPDSNNLPSDSNDNVHESKIIESTQKDNLEQALEEVVTQKIDKLSAEAEENLQNAKDAPIQFAGKESTTINPNKTEASLTISAGTLIPIIFLTDVNSELPGFALTQVARDLIDSKGRSYIKQGTKILLQYEATYSDCDRLAYKAVSMTLPSGKTVPLSDLPVVDISGHIGLKDKSNHHVVRNTLANIANIGMSQANNTIAGSIQSMENSTTPIFPSAIGNTYTQKPTTFYIRTGFECNVLLTKDLTITLEN
jgi:type IV secretion system protein VirB10